MEEVDILLGWSRYHERIRETFSSSSSSLLNAQKESEEKEHTSKSNRHQHRHRHRHRHRHLAQRCGEAFSMDSLVSASGGTSSTLTTPKSLSSWCLSSSSSSSSLEGACTWEECRRSEPCGFGRGGLRRILRLVHVSSSLSDLRETSSPRQAIPVSMSMSMSKELEDDLCTSEDEHERESSLSLSCLIRSTREIDRRAKSEQVREEDENRCGVLMCEMSKRREEEQSNASGCESTLVEFVDYIVDHAFDAVVGMDEEESTSEDDAALSRYPYRDAPVHWKALDLSSNSISDLEVGILHPMWSALQSLGMVDMSSNCVSSFGACLLFQSLQACASTLRGLSLASNFLEDEGVRLLSKYLHLFPCLESLDLSDNGISDSSMDPLGESVRLHPSLRCLRLSRNQIGSHGVSMLSSHWKSNDCIIRQVDLYGTKLGNRGAMYLVDLLRENRNICSITIGASGISEPRWMDILFDALEINRELFVIERVSVLLSRCSTSNPIQQGDSLSHEWYSVLSSVFGVMAQQCLQKKSLLFLRKYRYLAFLRQMTL